MNKIKLLRLEGYPKSFRWAQCNHNEPYKRKLKVSESEKEI